jgi:HAD superfamily hydrolase (TIGR01509 family)
MTDYCESMVSDKFPLQDIQFVLLDMDGTLLDKYFDDFFWEHLVPEKYAEKHAMTFGRAKEDLMEKYKVHEGTLNWTDLDFWSQELNLDIPALKEQIKHLIEVHPHVEDFLKMLKRMKKKVFLVTNAHYKSIDLKFRKTEIGRYFDSVLSSFDAGYPKESLKFWTTAEKRLGFDKQKTLFIDDTEEILRTAKQYGIKYILYKARSNSKVNPKSSPEFMQIHDFDELIPSR